MQEKGLNKFRTIVSEVSSFVANPVYYAKFDYFFTVLYFGYVIKLVLDFSYYVPVECEQNQTPLFFHF